MALAKNPILSGFYPDPSICRVDDTYYLVNSTFGYFPGIPIFQSKDLANWEQIGNILDRESQLPLADLDVAQKGIYAPAIRYYNGVFYLACTNVGHGENFVVTATNPAGPWSDPYFLGKDARGIDPSLFFDDDGTCYYIGTREKPDGRYYGDNDIWVQPFDINQMKLVGESHAIYGSTMKDAVWPEGPHLYKINGWYYLLNAEGGTCDDHCVVIARSKNVYGPYETYKKNPIITHRHLGRNYPVDCVGHADLVSTPDGRWFMIMLATRPQNGYTFLGRETYLASVEWQNEWPVVNPMVGRLEDTVETGLEEVPVLNGNSVYLFDEGKFPMDVMMFRNPTGKEYSFTDRKGYLRLYAGKETLKDTGTPAYVCVRVKEHNFYADTELEFSSNGKSNGAGLAVFFTDQSYITFEQYLDHEVRKYRVIKKHQEREEVLYDAEAVSDSNILRVAVYGGKMSFYLMREDGTCNLVFGGVNISFLSVESAWGFTGATVGMYATGNGQSDGSFADFKRLVYHSLV